MDAQAISGWMKERGHSRRYEKGIHIRRFECERLQMERIALTEPGKEKERRDIERKIQCERPRVNVFGARC